MTPPGTDPDSDSAGSVHATIVAELPQRLFRLRTLDGQEITAGPSAQLKRLSVTLKPGDDVLVRRAKLDPARGVIVGPPSGGEVQ